MSKLAAGLSSWYRDVHASPTVWLFHDKIQCFCHQSFRQTVPCSSESLLVMSRPANRSGIQEENETKDPTRKLLCNNNKKKKNRPKKDNYSQDTKSQLMVQMLWICWCKREWDFIGHLQGPSCVSWQAWMWAVLTERLFIWSPKKGGWPTSAFKTKA